MSVDLVYNYNIGGQVCACTDQVYYHGNTPTLDHSMVGCPRPSNFIDVDPILGATTTCITVLHPTNMWNLVS